MSVGRTTGRPSPIASTASSTRRSSVDHSLTSCEILPDRDVLVAEPAQELRDVLRLAVRDLERQRAAGDEAGQRLLGDRRGLAGLDQRRARLVLGDLRCEAVDLLRRDVRRVRDDEVERARRAPRRARPRRARRPGRCAPRCPPPRRARPASSPSRSRARRSCSSLIASAIAPEPDADVEHTRLGQTRESSRQRSTSTSVSGRGMRTRESTVQRQPAKAPLAQHVRERLPRRPPRDELAEDALLLRRRPVSVRVQLRPRHPERVREQPLRVDARRRHPGSAQLVRRRRPGGRGRSLFERAGAGPRRSAPR